MWCSQLWMFRPRMVVPPSQCCWNVGLATCLCGVERWLLFIYGVWTPKDDIQARAVWLDMLLV